MKNNLMDDNREDLRTIAEIIENIQVCMLTTVDRSGNLCSRPMAAEQLDEDGNLWFFTLSTSHLLDDVRHTPTVSVTFASPAQNSYIAATAVAYEAFDRSKMEELWDPSLRVWFREGLDTQDITLLKLDLQEVEFWDGPGMQVSKIVNFMKSVVGDDKPLTGRHEKVDLRQ